jgi:hypothetical protein
MTGRHGKSRTHGRPGIDANQRELRRRLGLEVPRDPPPKSTEKLVGPVVAIECTRCGCVNARPAGAKDRTCQFCGKK